jgi:hypothetical protein
MLYTDAQSERGLRDAPAQQADGRLFVTASGSRLAYRIWFVFQTMDAARNGWRDRRLQAGP